VHTQIAAVIFVQMWILTLDAILLVPLPRDATSKVISNKTAEPVSHVEVCSRG
jgi:hypothetical protein